MENIFKGLPALSEPHKKILLAKEGRLEKFKKHIDKGGDPLSFLPLLIGDGYGEFWKTKKRYRVVKGSRASKKTVTIARNFIYNLMKHPGSNLLVVRKVNATNKDSTYSELKKAIYDLGVQDHWRAKVNPLEIVYIPTGQKILFRGLDDPLKIAGVTVEVGHLCWVWINFYRFTHK
jgi:phage terminase large subunit